MRVLTICLLFLSGMPGNVLAAELTVERLTWAGIKLVSGDTTVFVDAVGTDIWSGNAPEGLVPVVADTPRRYALITHAHNDHFDTETLKEVLGERGYVICHESIATYVASRGLRVIPAGTWRPVERGGFIFTAVPAEDGLGDEQVSWIISTGDHRFLHAGDSLWHGAWAIIGRHYGPFDAVFLPINGAKIQRDPMPETAAVMNPMQAIDAAIMLRAGKLVPIHFGLSDPPYYVEAPEPLTSLLDIAHDRALPVQHLQPGELLTLDHRTE